MAHECSMAELRPAAWMNIQSRFALVAPFQMADSGRATLAAGPCLPTAPGTRATAGASWPPARSTHVLDTAAPLRNFQHDVRYLERRRRSSAGGHAPTG